VKTVKGSLWSLELSHYLVIPTNIGWTSKGENIMGKGVAKQAFLKYSKIAAFFGTHCKKHKENAGVILYPDSFIIFFPVKELNPEAPWLSWKNDASLPLIERSCKELVELSDKEDIKPIALPMVGCGAGNLRKEDVIPVLEKYFTTDNYVLVMQ
jgi:hypothetical protein